MDVMGKRRALGRGLGALIPDAYAESSAAEATAPLHAIRPNPQQPRQTFSEASIAELAESIRQKGILQPLLVRRSAAGYELIAGERRYRAAQRLGLQHVPIVVREVGDGEMLELALIENIQREDLNPLEEARAYRRLLDEFDLTQEEIATRVGKHRSTVANALRLLSLPEAIQADVAAGRLSAGHARALVTVGSDSARLHLAREAVSQGLSVREVERRAKHNGTAVAAADIRAVEQRLSEALGTKVRVHGRADGGGRIEIDYYSLDQLDGLIARLTAAPTDKLLTTQSTA